MNKFGAVLLLSFFLLTSITAAADLPFGRAADRIPTQPQLDRLALEFELLRLEGHRARIEAEAAKRREAQYQEHRFIEKVNRFVRVWGVFVSQYNDKQTFDCKSARELSKAFHELESSGFWPAPQRK